MRGNDEKVINSTVGVPAKFHRSAQCDISDSQNNRWHFEENVNTLSVCYDTKEYQTNL